MFNPAFVEHNAPARDRIGVLADRIAMYVDSLVPQGRARCLDVGCGDMTLAEAVERRKSRTVWRCIDVHPLPSELREDARWRKYGRFDGRTIPYDDDEFDVALLCDVLHRAPADAPRFLAEAGRVARHVLVKDHFEHGPCSRTMLRLMDRVDTRSCGVEIPYRYFTRDGFVRLVSEQRLHITALDCELELHEPLPGARKRKPERPFIAVLNRG